MKLKELWIEIKEDAAHFERGIKRVNKQADTVAGRIQKRFNSINFKKAAMAAVAFTGTIALIGKHFISAADRAEQYRVRLEVLLGSQSKAARMFKSMADFAGKVPFSYDQIMESATSLSGVLKGGVDQVRSWMPVIADLAATTGLTIADTTGQFIRMFSAGAASADMFRERGVLSMLGFKAGVSYTAAETQRILYESWSKVDSQFRGATDKLSGTWKGLTSMLGDAWFQFRVTVMESGVMDYLKDRLTETLAKLEAFKKSGKFDEFAKNMADNIISGLGKVNSLLASIYEKRDVFGSVFNGTLQVASNLVTIVDNLKFIGSWANNQAKQGLYGGAGYSTAVPGMPYQYRAKEINHARTASKVNFPLSTSSGSPGFFPATSPSSSGSTPAPAPAPLPSNLIKFGAAGGPLTNPSLGFYTPSQLGTGSGLGQFAGQGGGQFGMMNGGDSFQNRAQEMLNKTKELAGQTTQATATIRRGWMSVGNTMGSVLGSSLTQAGATFGSIAGSFKNMLVSMAADLASKAAMFGILNLFSGGAMGAATKGLGGFLGFRADGGDVYSGRSYIVGEKGPELFTPKSAGYITPNNQLDGGQKTFNLKIVTNEKPSMMDAYQFAALAQKADDLGLLEKAAG